MKGRVRNTMEDELFKKMERDLALPIALAKEMIASLGKEKAREIILRAYIAYQSERLISGMEHLPPEKRDLRVYGKKVREITDSYQGNIELVEASDKVIRLKVKRCIPWEIFKKHGVPEMGLLFCECDFEATKAINPRMKLIRTKTISAGHDECNHMWVMEE
jgi:hypothetical protein